MKIELFEMERMQSTWENVVEIDLSESGVRAVVCGVDRVRVRWGLVLIRKAHASFGRAVQLLAEGFMEKVSRPC